MNERMNQRQLTREELFIQVGASPEVASVASEASYIPPKKRTPEQKEAIHQVSELIAKNARRED
jgi:hypothetical protein